MNEKERESDGRQVSSADKKRQFRQEYSSYLLFERVPIRFGMILVPELVLSCLLYAGVLTRIIIPVYRPIHALVLLGFWAYIWWLAIVNRGVSISAGDYYLCTVIANVLFLFVAFIVFRLAYFSSDYPLDMLYYPFFRLSLIIGLLGDRLITADEIPRSLAIFYSVTVLISLIEPMFALIMEKLCEAVDEVELKKDRRRAKREYLKYLSYMKNRDK